MGKKIISLFTIVLFIAFSYSCYATHAIKVDVNTEGKLKGKNVRLIKLQKSTGEYVKFQRGQQARIHEGNIVGSLSEKKISIKNDALEKIDKDKNGNITRIITKDGRGFDVMTAKEEGDRVIFSVSDFAHIPLNEVDVIWVRKPSTILTVGAVLGVLALMGFAMGGPMAGVQFFDDFMIFSIF